MQHPQFSANQFEKCMQTKVLSYLDKIQYQNFIYAIISANNNTSGIFVDLETIFAWIDYEILLMKLETIGIR